MTTDQNIDDLLVVDGLAKTYGNAELVTHALRPVYLRVKRGDFLAITGPSGSGKTTLLSLLGLLESPTSGTYSVAGIRTERLDDSGLSAVRRQQIGFVFQNSNLIASMSVLENVQLPLLYLGRTNAREMAMHALEQVGLLGRARHTPSQLSGGQLQRAAFARVIASDPPLVLADEPTGNLDTRSGEALLEILEEMHAAGKAIVMVTHNEAAASRAHRRLLVSDGMLHEYPAKVHHASMEQF